MYYVGSNIIPTMYQLQDPLHELKLNSYNFIQTNNLLKTETQKIVIHDLRFLNERLTIKKLESIPNIKCKFIHFNEHTSKKNI